jgi:hypothetical protein
VQKIRIAFPRKVPELLAFARTVRASISSSPFFTNISSEFGAVLALLAETIDKLQVAQDESLTGGSAKRLYRDTVRDELLNVLKKVSKHVELVADGDVKVLKSSGFEVIEGGARKERIPAQLDQMQVVLKHGPEKGTFVAKGKPISYALSYEAHIAQGDPTNAENWRHYGFFPHCSHMIIGGMTGGEDYSLRFRVITAKGEGPWSAIHTLMSL